MNDDTEKVQEQSSEQNIKKAGSGRKKKDEVRELKTKIEELEDQIKRAVADYRNQEMRFEEEKREFVKFANKELLLRLIPSFDVLFLASKHTQDEGVRLTIDSVTKALRDVGVEGVKAEGEKFNPELMEAVSTTEGEEGKVIEEMMPGYTLNGRLLRASLVRVGKGK